MASGYKLLELMNDRGNPNQYADLVFGTVISANPLKIQLSEKMILTDAFLIKGLYVTDHEENMVIDGVSKKVTIKQALKADDKVAMFRLDGGQSFYILEKVV